LAKCIYPYQRLRAASQHGARHALAFFLLVGDSVAPVIAVPHDDRGGHAGGVTRWSGLQRGGGGNGGGYRAPPVVYGPGTCIGLPGATVGIY
jgi:hypothetical protein